MSCPRCWGSDAGRVPQDEILSMSGHDPDTSGLLSAFSVAPEAIYDYMLDSAMN